MSFPMTDSNEADYEAAWAIEIEREGEPAEYYSILGMKATGSQLHIVTTNKEHLAFEKDGIRKILVMNAQPVTT